MFLAMTFPIYVSPPLRIFTDDREDLQVYKDIVIGVAKGSLGTLMV